LKTGSRFIHSEAPARELVNVTVFFTLPHMTLGKRARFSTTFQEYYSDVVAKILNFSSGFFCGGRQPDHDYRSDGVKTVPWLDN